ncbi:MAG: radical SAM protein [Ponticaulis sp.]|nr:radical SAM protein [Ponticaulis sp.]
MTTLISTLPDQKFSHPDITAKGETRATVSYTGTKTLWFNTGTLCNIECSNCYIESSPTNDRLVYLTLADVTPYLDELQAAGEAPIEIGITGGEPFMAPEIIAILEAILERGHELLVLTNAMQPMMRPRIQTGLLDLQARFGDRITMRISIDHYAREHHDEERGAGSYDLTLKGTNWLNAQGFQLALAGRTMWGEDEASERAGYARMISEHDLRIDPDDPQQLVLFPEMETRDDPPEITTDCWGILNKNPDDIMCASQRMVVKRKGAASPTVLACTLIPYDARFELGTTLKEAREPVSLNHPFCASFCVLGGGSCSA